MTVTPGELKAKVYMILAGLNSLSRTAGEPSEENALLIKFSMQVEWLSQMRVATDSFRQTLEIWQFYLHQVYCRYNDLWLSERNDDHNKFLGCLESLLMIKRVCNDVCDRLEVDNVE